MKKRIVLFFASLILTTHFYAQDASTITAWKHIQESTENAVVKIYSISRSFNWFNPYIVSSTYSSTGSGFFINNQGEIITNSHVVDNAIAVFIAIPALGKQRLKAEVISICPQHDLALLRLTSDSVACVKRVLKDIKYLELGDSDSVCRFDEVLTLGFPLDSENLKSTAGIVSGCSPVNFSNFSGYSIQIDASINPGNSGGPLFNKNGIVIGINHAGRNDAQNYNFAIPVNNLKTILPDLYKQSLLRINNIGLVWFYATDEIRQYYGNPLYQGCCVCSVEPNSKGDAAGIQANDMIYEVNGYAVDSYGAIVVNHGEKIDFNYYVGQLPVGSEVTFLLYRQGIPFTCSIVVDYADTPSMFKYPSYEQIDYEVFGGMIVMELTANYVAACSKERPGLQRYLTALYAQKPRLVVANILADSKLAQMRTISYSDTINELNGEQVRTLNDFRQALQKSIETGAIVIKVTNEQTLSTDNILTVLSLEESCKETVQLAQIHQYPLSETVRNLIQQVDSTLL